ncbi:MULTISPECIES: hypothetical protein [Actinomycetes]|uniref:hypothetical protein n=1 Tax=Actinomycetes TaxID=1760 RepID=UPI00078613EE|nr:MULTISPECIES: hypothetical protein [Streptomyces]RWZ73126.1 hypothetical protein EQK42_26030 [Streptomyces albidoflavus]
MKKIMLAALPALALSLAASTAHADEAAGSLDGGISAENNFDHATSLGPVPLTGDQQIALVPVLASYVWSQKNSLANSSLLDHG